MIAVAQEPMMGLLRPRPAADILWQGIAGAGGVAGRKRLMSQLTELHQFDILDDGAHRAAPHVAEVREPVSVP